MDLDFNLNRNSKHVKWVPDNHGSWSSFLGQNPGGSFVPQSLGLLILSLRTPSLFASGEQLYSLIETVAIERFYVLVETVRFAYRDRLYSRIAARSECSYSDRFYLLLERPCRDGSPSAISINDH